MPMTAYDLGLDRKASNMVTREMPRHLVYRRTLPVRYGILTHAPRSIRAEAWPSRYSRPLPC